MTDPLDWPTGRLLATAARLAEHAWTEHLRAHDLTHAGILVLHVLADGPASQHQLALRCQVEEQTMSRTLERLGRSGFVLRRRDEQDRRRMLVERTPAGARSLDAARDTQPSSVGVLDEVEDPEQFRRQLARIVEVLGAHRWPPG